MIVFNGWSATSYSGYSGMKKGLSALFLFLLIWQSCFGQEELSTIQIINSQTGKAIADAHIYISEKGTFLVSDSAGFAQLYGDSLKIEISHIAYFPDTLWIHREHKVKEIAVSPVLYELDTLQYSTPVFDPVFYYDKNLRIHEIERRKVTSPLAELEAEFPGGMKEFHAYLLKGIWEHGRKVQKRFSCEALFTILKDGSLQVDTIFNAGEEGFFLRDLFSGSPPWIPAFQRNKPVESSYAQSISFSGNDDILLKAQESPEYKGGQEDLLRFLSSRIRYPSQANKRDIEGKVYISFVVNQLGELEDVRVEKGIGWGCDEEAARVIKLTSGNWFPGTVEGKPVKVKMIMPIMFGIKTRQQNMFQR